MHKEARSLFIVTFILILITFGIINIARIKILTRMNHRVINLIKFSSLYQYIESDVIKYPIAVQSYVQVYKYLITIELAYVISVRKSIARTHSEQCRNTTIMLYQ